MKQRNIDKPRVICETLVSTFSTCTSNSQIGKESLMETKKESIIIFYIHDGHFPNCLRT